MMVLMPGGLGIGSPRVLDPHFASVISLLHCDGAPNSTDFPDVIPARSWTPTAATVDGTVFKFGNGSLEVGGNGDIKADTSEDWDLGTGDFTIEFWFRFKAFNGGGAQTLFSNYQGPASGYGIQYRTDGGGGNRLNVFTVGDSFSYAFAWSPSVDTWYHIAITRASGNIRAFVNGSQVGTTQACTDDLGETDGPYIGQLWGDSDVQQTDGFYDDFRVTKGIARYTSGFSVPTSAFPNE
jgi:hypothetical protein